MGGIMGGGGKGSKKSTQTSTIVRTLPGWLKGPYQDLISQAQDLASQPFTPYDYQERVAPLSADEQAAFELIRSQGGAYQDNIDSAIGGTGSLLNQILAGPTEAALESRMNPFLQQVLDRQRYEAERGFDISRQNLADQAQAAGAYGGSRFAVAENEMLDDYLDNLSNLQASGMYNAYETARQQYNQDMASGMAGYGQMANLGQMGQAGIANQAGMLQTAGQQARGIEQALADAKYGEFAREQMFPYDNINMLNQILAPAAGTMAGQTSTNVTEKKGGGGSLFSKIVGTGLSIAGMATGNPFLSMAGSAVGGVSGGGGGAGSAMGFGLSTGGQGLFSGGLGNMFNSARGFYGPGFAEGGKVPNTGDLSLADYMKEIQKEKQQEAVSKLYQAHYEDQERLQDYYDANEDPTATGLLNMVLEDVVKPKRKPPSVIMKAMAGPERSGPKVAPFMDMLNEEVEGDKLSMEDIQRLFPKVAFAEGGRVPLFAPLFLASEEEKAEREAQRTAPKRNPLELLFGPDAHNRFETGLSSADALGDYLRRDENHSGSRLDRFIGGAADLPRKSLGVALEGAILPAKGLRGIKNFLAENPDAALAEEQMAEMAERGGMSSEERAIMDVIDILGPEATPEMIGTALQRLPIADKEKKAPTEEKGKVVTKQGREIPVESKKGFISEKQAAEIAGKKQEEERKMNLPLLMAGMAMMGSDGDFFEAAAEGIGAYVQTQEAIEGKKIAAEDKAYERSMDERKMQVEEGKLDILRGQLQADIAKISKERGIKPETIQDDITNLFGKIVELQAGSIMPGQDVDMGQMISDAYGTSRQLVGQMYGVNLGGAEAPKKKSAVDELEARLMQIVGQ